MPEVPFLAVEGLSAFYGGAQALEDVSFEIAKESVAIVGRNGMGKTTLCNAIMGITPPRARGSIRFQGEEILGKSSSKVANLGLGYVPQGRRLFPSLSVDEHLRMIRGRASGAPRTWDVPASTTSFPASPSASGTGGHSSPAASSRCSRSDGRC